jgi:hypothetical protein
LSEPQPSSLDGDLVVRRVAEQAAAALADAWVRTALLEAQLSAARQAPPEDPT